MTSRTMKVIIHRFIGAIIITVQTATRTRSSCVISPARVRQIFFLRFADPSTTGRFSRNDTLSPYKHHYLIALNVRLSNDALLYVYINQCLIQFIESSDIHRVHVYARTNVHAHTHTHAPSNALIKIIRALVPDSLFEDRHYGRFPPAHGCSCQGR